MGNEPIENVPLDCIRAESGINPRAGGCDTLTVEEYTVAWESGAEFPPLVVYRDDDGTTWLSEGFHRFEAAKLAEGIEAVPCIVRVGGRREALLNAVGSNATHGRRRTNEDKRRAVELLLDDPEWAKKSDRWIAERCAVSNHLVGMIRKNIQEPENNAGGNSPTCDNGRDGQDGKTYRRRRRRRKRKDEPKQEPQTDDDEPEDQPDEPATPKPFDFDSEADKVEKLCRSAMDRWPADKRDLLSKIFVQMSKEALHWA